MLDKKQLIEKLFSKQLPLEEAVTLVKEWANYHLIEDSKLRMDVRKKLNEYSTYRLSGDSSKEDECFVNFIEYLKESMAMMYTLAVQDALEVFLDQIKQAQQVTEDSSQES